MSDARSSAEVMRPSVQLVRLPVEKPHCAVEFLHARSQGVMDLIAHFWERLAQTPPLQRSELHLLVATHDNLSNQHINISDIDSAALSGAMLYVPKAHRADVLALDPSTAAAFAAYISHRGAPSLRAGAGGPPPMTLLDGVAASAGLPLTDMSTAAKGIGAATELPADVSIPASNSPDRVAIDFLTGHADGIEWMVPLLLPVVHRKAPARQLVNVVMQLAADAICEADPNVRPARESDVPTLNRWRRQYKEERGILFDADLDAWIQTGRIFVYEHEKQVVAAAKFDLELPRLIEIGGVYTFPEFRQRGFGGRIVCDMARRVREDGKIPTLQVDEKNQPALQLYQGSGWKEMGKLSRVWLTG